MTARPDITAIINAHREGNAARPSLLSVQRALDRAGEKGLTVEVIAVLDRADRNTLEMFEGHRDWLRILAVDHGDLGKSRNSGVEAASGKWVAFLDADDLWSSNWLTAAFAAAESDPRLVVWHPVVNIYFDQHPRIYTHVDMEDATFDPGELVLTNCWTALCFAPRSLLLEVPYRPTDLAAQIGFEDWTWNLETIERGALHKTVADTGHVIHSKAVSLLKQSSAANCMPMVPDFLRRIVSERNPAT